MKDPKDQATADLLPAPKKRGRPAKHGTQAEKQKAYRERLKEKGLRVVSKIVRDVRPEKPLQSDVIDLSEVKKK